LLGLFVVRTLIKNHSLNELTHWRTDEIHKNVILALKEISTGAR
jgi:hypothetical protein